MQYTLEKVECTNCGAYHEKVTVLHGISSDFYHCDQCGETIEVN